jgi:hypothetical protein
MTASAGHVFISHSSDNRELANELSAFIEARGVKVWIAPRDVRPGKDYSEQLQLAIESCAAFVVLVTEMANKSPYVRAETEMAFSTHKPIFPVRISDIQPAAGLAFFLKIRHWTDAFGPGKSESLNRLVQELQVLAPAPSPPAPAPAAGAAPAMAVSAPASPPAGPRMAAAPATPALPRAPVMPSTPEEEEKWSAAIGPKAEYYLKRWREMEAKNSTISWNWPACLANIFWFAYRKVWGPVVILAIAYLVLTAWASARPEAARLVVILTIAISFVTGGFGNHLYRKHVARLVGENHSVERLRERGGVSVPAVVISAVAVVVLSLAVGGAFALRQQAQLQATNQMNSNLGTFEPATEPWQDPGTQVTDPGTDYPQDPNYEGVEGDKPTE